MVYVVLGMHKSGTTLIAETLHRSGINMGNFENGIIYRKGNKCERKETKDINMRLLGHEKGEYSLNITNRVKDINALDEKKKKEIRSFVESQNDKYMEWGFKDPKTCLVYSIWRPFISEYKLVVTFRHPLEVWSRYKPKGLKKSMVSIMHCWKVIKAWYIYNQEIYDTLKSEKNDFIVLEYSEFMNNDGGLNDLSRFLDRKLTDCRKGDLYRNKRQENLVYNVTVFLRKYLISQDVNILYEKLRGYAQR